MSNTLRIGLSEVSITPEKSISLVGQFYERISEYVETPITCTCLVIEKDGEKIYFNIPDKTADELGLEEKAEITSATFSKIEDVVRERRNI